METQYTEIKKIKELANTLLKYTKCDPDMLSIMQ